MTFRLNEQTALQGIVQQLLQISQYFRERGLDIKLLELMSMRASQINGWNRLNIAFHNPPVPFTNDANEGVAADSWCVVNPR